MTTNPVTQLELEEILMDLQERREAFDRQISNRIALLRRDIGFETNIVHNLKKSLEQDKKRLLKDIAEAARALRE
jgi:hypothetical protein